MQTGTQTQTVEELVAGFTNRHIHTSSELHYTHEPTADIKATSTDITYRLKPDTQQHGNTNPMSSLTSAASSEFPKQPRLLSSKYSTFTAIQQNKRGEWGGGFRRRQREMGGGENNNQ